MIRFLQNPTKTRKVVLALILGFVIVSMVAYLGQAFTSNGPTAQGVYATVAGEPVTTMQVSQSARRIAQQRLQGQAVPEQYMPIFQKQAAEQLIMQASLVSEANRMGLKVSDQELRDELQQGNFARELFPNGNFIGEAGYTNFIANAFQMDVPTFERIMKQDILVNKLRSIVEGGVGVPDAEVQREFQKQNVKVKFDYAVLGVEDLAKQVQVNDTELRAYYDKNKARYQNSIPEQRKARYIVVDASKVPVQITEDDYKRAYAQRQDTFKEEEQADVRHILVKTKEEADKIKKELEAGGNFDVLAKKYSQDPGSKDNGGLYKGVTKGKMVPAFDKATFTQPVGKLSDPVQTDFGFHIIRVDARREARVKPLNEVKPELEKAIRAEKSATQVDSLANAIVTEARTSGLDKAAAKNGLNVITTDFFDETKTLPGIGSDPQFMQAMFLSHPKSPAEKIQIPQGFAIAEVIDSKPPATPTFEQAKSKVETEFRNERAGGMLAKKIEELADKARSMKDLNKAAKEVGATVKTSELVSPSGQVAELGAMSGPAAVAFDMSPGQISGALAIGQKGAVIALKEKQEPSSADYAKQQEQLRQQLTQRKRGEVMQLFAENLRQRMQKDGSIKVNAQEEKRLFGSLAGS
ncbi:MAG: PpiC-type peptidyl-prolyl cis-trans isomerase [Acidobacteriales bacterium]|nr:PpiC-type peptidyl-prolyl cis-trans isomerase [Terriglobales bacterium]